MAQDMQDVIRMVQLVLSNNVMMIPTVQNGNGTWRLDSRERVVEGLLSDVDVDYELSIYGSCEVEQ